MPLTFAKVYECERRHQMLVERLNALKRTNPLFPRLFFPCLILTLFFRNQNR